MGNDFDVPIWGTPICSITTGKVIYANLPPEYYQPGHSSIGYVITIQNDDGSIIHYQHMKTTSVKVGQRIGVGTLLGTSGGCPEGCYGNNGQCTCRDNWTTGQHIEVRFSHVFHGIGNDPFPAGDWIDPWPIIRAVVASGATFQDTSGGRGGQVISGITNALANNPLKPNESVAAFLNGLDQAQSITNPFGVTVPSGTLGVPDIGGYISAVSTNIAADMGAIVLDGFFILIGTVMCIKVIAEITHAGTLIKNVAAFAPLLAA